MINVYKAGGAWKTEEGKEYTVKTVNESTTRKHLADGWSTSLEDALKEIEGEKELTPQEKAAITRAKNKELESE